MEDEVFVNGFCKAQNQSRMVICEVERDEQGKMILVDTDCAWGKCSHTADCLLINQAFPQEN